MRASEIEAGEVYLAKVSGRVVRVRVDEVRHDGSQMRGGKRGSDATRYDVTNLSTGRKTTFRTAGKFRSRATKESTAPSQGESLGERLARRGLIAAQNPQSVTQRVEDPSAALLGDAGGIPANLVADNPRGGTPYQWRIAGDGVCENRPTEAGSAPERNTRGDRTLRSGGAG